MSEHESSEPVDRRGVLAPLRKRFGDASGDRGQSVATDGSDNVVITGWFTGSVDFGGGLLTSLGQEDIFLAKLAP